MSQFARIKGTRARDSCETEWFSRPCNELNLAIGYRLLAAAIAAIYQPVRRKDKKARRHKDKKAQASKASTGYQTRFSSSGGYP